MKALGDSEVISGIFMTIVLLCFVGFGLWIAIAPNPNHGLGAIVSGITLSVFCGIFAVGTLYAAVDRYRSLREDSHDPS